MHCALPSVVLVPLLLVPAAAQRGRKVTARCAADVEHALRALEKQCGHFFRIKGIDWKKVAREFKKAARKVRTLQEHYELLARLTARLRDGHARVNVAEGAGKLRWPGDPGRKQAGTGVFLCRNGKRILIKNAWSAAARAGVRAGMEVVAIDGRPAAKWLDEKVAELRVFRGYSTDDQAFFAACHWGMAGDVGSKMKLELRAAKSKKKTVSVRRDRASYVPGGPVFPPPGLTRIGRQSYGKTPAGFGYIHLRDTKRAILDQLDTMLAALRDVPGLILDFRANGGGGFDHDAALGRFVPAGKKLIRRKAYPIPSAGTHPYGGPIVVIVDAGTRSAGETGSGMFKEDGRAYMIGETPTAGMSSSKTTIELPSGLFSLYVSVRSNKKRFNNGRGIEGIGVQPHEIVPYDPAELTRGVDTLIRRAEDLLRDFPADKVPYRLK